MTTTTIEPQETPPDDAAQAPSRRRVSPWLVLVIACLAQFMVVLDITVVNIALPSVQRGLHFSSANLQWVVNGYTLIFGGFLLLGGRAADLLGRKRLFVAGVVLFSAASLLNGLAQSSGMLIVGRGLQGLGGALVSPAALAIITTTFTDASERTKALGIWSAIAASGSAVGLLLGGALTDLASWRWVFFVNVPVGIVTVLLALRYIAESRLENVRRSYDLGGAVTVTGGLVVIVYAIVKAQSFGWGSPRTLGLFAAGVALLAAFYAIERRAEAPLMRLSIFRVRSLAVGDAALLLIASGMFGMFYFASLYVQDVLGYSPLKAGLAFLPVTAGIMIGAAAAQQLIKRFGVRNVSIAGTTLAALGMLVLTQLPVHGSYASDLLTGLMPMSIGMGLVFVPITLMGTSGVSGDDAGLASGLFNTAQQVGGSLGLAILSTLAASRTSHLLSSHSATKVAATVSGYHVAFLAAAVMFAVAVALLVVLLRKRHMEEVERAIEAGETAPAVA
ncbi:MAG TPA: MFS transporter [Solirubrobacteraceae bacterium]|jgi:EmrB/QacA subfamily drug resistance transporter|nr:MFS transporter [Solirubrobacteraceae bacterium]